MPENVITEAAKPRPTGLSIEPVAAPEDLRAFIELPWKIYDRLPHWVPPIKAEIEELLGEKNPFWKHAERELFLAKRGGEIVGRCAAIVDSLYNDFQGEKTGFFGFFESIDDPEVAQALLSASRDWLKAKGMTILRGPASPSLNEECGVLIEGFDDPPTIMMPYTPRYYPALLEKCGLRKAKDLYSYILISNDLIPKRIQVLAKRVMRKGKVTLRHLTKKTWEKDLQAVRDIYNAAWEKNWGFAPMTPEELEYMIVKMKPILDLDLVHFMDVDGETAAFSILLPDVNQALHHLDGKLGVWGSIKFLYYFRKISRCRLITLGVKKAFRNRGLEVPLYREAWLVARRKGYNGDLGWILEDNERMNAGMRA
ncbi:MAG: N-acetyltransferase, partial [Elusimicrobiota bacterium]